MPFRSRHYLSALLCLIAWLMSSVAVQAVTLRDSHGLFTLNYQPKRIIALEYSFVDALAAVGVSPVGIADDNDPSRIMPAIRQQLSPWTSVGTRSQPSLEVIASLKPDLIIADADRHAAVYNELAKIAPVLLLPSRRETYQRNLLSAKLIGEAVGRSKQMDQRIELHQQRMDQYKSQLRSLSGSTLQFAVVRPNGFYAHSPDSYDGGVFSRLGLESPQGLNNEHGSRQISVEQLLALNPDYLVLGGDVSLEMVGKWKTKPLWSLLKAVQHNHILLVNSRIWVECRGMLAAEFMAQDLLKLVKA